MYTLHVEFVLASTPYGVEKQVRRLVRKRETSSGYCVLTGTQDMQFVFRSKDAARAALLRVRLIKWVDATLTEVQR